MKFTRAETHYADSEQSNLYPLALNAQRRYERAVKDHVLGCESCGWEYCEPHTRLVNMLLLADRLALEAAKIDKLSYHADCGIGVGAF